MLRLDGGSIYGQLVGDSEKNMRNALAVADAMSPCVLFVDEIEKAMSGLQSSGKCDGGTSSRVIGTFLQWMQDKKSMVFVVATANDVSQLPPEILRRGRFDQIFFVDLPDKEERDEIWKIHIKNTGRKVKDFDVGRLSELTDKFTGAEIESIVADGLLNAFDAGTEPTTDIFAEAVKEVVPLSSTMGERIQAMRKWATNRAISASGKPIVV
jgi:SpoVK/Ycf46/Vps4 family AAA+-type ATPase